MRTLAAAVNLYSVTASCIIHVLKNISVYIPAGNTRGYMRARGLEGPAPRYASEVYHRTGVDGRPARDTRQVRVSPVCRRADCRPRAAAPGGRGGGRPRRAGGGGPQRASPPGGGGDRPPPSRRSVTSERSPSPGEECHERSPSPSRQPSNIRKARP